MPKTIPPTLPNNELSEIAASISFTMYGEERRKLAILQQRLNLKRSKVIRRAIDLLYEQETLPDEPTQA